MKYVMKNKIKMENETIIKNHISPEGLTAEIIKAGGYAYIMLDEDGQKEVRTNKSKIWVNKLLKNINWLSLTH